MRKIPAHKKIILFYAILPVLSSRVPFRSVRSLGTPQRFYSHILSIFCVLYTGFQKRPPFSSILYGKLSFGAFISCFFRKILTFWNFPIEKYTNLVYIYLAEERICVSRPIDPKCIFCSLTKNTIRKVLIKLWKTTARRSSMRTTPLPLPSPLRCLRLCCRTTPNATATRQACMRSARLQKSRLRKHVQK